MRPSLLLTTLLAACGSGGDSPTDGPGGTDAPAAVDAVHGADAAVPLDERIYFERSDGIWYRDMATSAEAKVSGSLAGDQLPAVSADGLRLAFDRGGDIYVLDLPSGTPVDLTPAAGTEAFPAWSPDRARLAFVSDRVAPPRLDLWVMNADGTAPVSIQTAVEPSRVAWSPDGTRIAFAYWPTGSMRVWTIAPDGTGLSILGPVPDDENQYFDHDPAYSPDGSRVAFTTDRVTAWFQVYTMASTGTGAPWLPVVSADFDTYAPAWSPDGLRLAYCADAGAGMQVFIVAADASTPPVALTATDTLSTCQPFWR